jgi:signal transduction histidine kinase/putative methionine-R-sulfoxide reductase with GAF domain
MVMVVVMRVGLGLPGKVIAGAETCARRASRSILGPSVTGRRRQDQARERAVADDEVEHLRSAAEEQAALRRVATLVALEAEPEDVFAGLATELARVLRVPLISMLQYDRDGCVQVGSWGDNPYPVGTRWTLDEPSIATRVAESGRPSRIDDYREEPGTLAADIALAGFRSAVGVPIVVAGVRWGVVIAVSRDAALPPFTETRLVGFVELLAMAIANTAARTEVRLLAAEQAALRRVATLIAQQASPDVVFAAVAHEVAQTLDIPLSSLVRVERDGTATQVGAWGSANPVPVGTTWTVDAHGVTGRVWRTGRPARVDDYGSIPGPIAARLAREAGICSAVGVPITVGGAVWGVMFALDHEPASLPADTEDRLARFTELVATALADTQARTDQRRLADEQAALRRVAALVARGEPAQAVFDAVCEETGRLLGAATTNLAHFAPGGWDETMSGWSLDGKHVPTGTRLPIGDDSVDSMVLATLRPARIESYDGARGELTALLQRLGIRSEVGAPVIVEGEPWGALIAGWDTGAAPPPGIELRLAQFADLVATAIANAQSRSELDALAQEQAALRRVATLVANQAPPAQVFAAVAEEVGRLLDVEATDLYRYEDAGASVACLASWCRDEVVEFPAHLSLDGVSVGRLVYDTGQATRIDDYATVREQAPGAVSSAWQRLGIRAAIGCPVMVDGAVWGVMSACRLRGAPIPAGAELRLASFTELIATAISNATTYDSLLASRARIVAAADEARRRIERDLHDGTQQQLVSLMLQVQAAQAAIPEESEDALATMERVLDGLDGVLTEIRELSRGLHPSLLARAGLAFALRGLARRSPVPASLHCDIEGRLAPHVEIAAYYAASEALANAAKHAQATAIRIDATVADGALRLSVQDDGRGGASVRGGSGLLGLRDRIEAADGRLTVTSAPGEGTSVRVELPLSSPLHPPTPTAPA